MSAQATEARDGLTDLRRALTRAAAPQHAPLEGNVTLTFEQLRDLLADTWSETTEEMGEWFANNPGPSGIPSDPPRNPYEW